MSEAVGRDEMDLVRHIAADLDRRWPAMHQPVAEVVPLARDLVTSGVRATVEKYLGLDDSPPLFAEALAACEGTS